MAMKVVDKQKQKERFEITVLECFMGRIVAGVLACLIS